MPGLTRFAHVDGKAFDPNRLQRMSWFNYSCGETREHATETLQKFLRTADWTMQERALKTVEGAHAVEKPAHGDDRSAHEPAGVH
jgi:hypothetical protein